MYRSPLFLVAMFLLLFSVIPAGAEIYKVDTDAYGTIVGISGALALWALGSDQDK